METPRKAGEDKKDWWHRHWQEVFVMQTQYPPDDGVLTTEMF